MKKYVLITSIISSMFISSNVNSMSLDEAAALNLPFFGIGTNYNVCYLHGDAFAVVSPMIICDVALLSPNKQNEVLSPENLVFVDKLGDIAWINSPQHTNQHAAGDPDCYDREPLSFNTPTW